MTEGNSQLLARSAISDTAGGEKVPGAAVSSFEEETAMTSDPMVDAVPDMLPAPSSHEEEQRLTAIEQRFATIRASLTTTEQEFATWIQRAQAQIAETRRAYDAFPAERLIQQHREALHALQQEFTQAVRDQRREITDLRRDARDIGTTLAHDVTRYRREVEDIRAAMQRDRDRGFAYQPPSPWLQASRTLLPTLSGRGGGCRGCLVLIGCAVLLLILCSLCGHLSAFMSSWQH